MVDVVLEPTKDTFVSESRCNIHPATLDMCLQLGHVAAYSGLAEDVTYVYVPVTIDVMSVWSQASAEAKGEAIAQSFNRDLRTIGSDIQLFNKHGDSMFDVSKL